MGMYRKRYRPSGSYYDKDDVYTTNNTNVSNPNPNNWQALQIKEIGKYLVLELKYPDCTNYEGRKILVFENITMIDLINQRSIDPHFSSNKVMKSPIARFVPTQAGWNMAVDFCKMLHEKGNKNALDR